MTKQGHIGPLLDPHIVAINGDHTTAEALLRGRFDTIFFTGSTRESSSILREQTARTERQLPELRELKRLAWEGRRCLERNDPDGLGRLLHEAWLIKRGLASAITNAAIDGMYERARQAGALGGKIAGAGGGGFLLLYVPVERQDAVRFALSGLSELPINLERDGSKVILNGRR
mgnify:CR=1 FL=1